MLRGEGAQCHPCRLIAHDLQAFRRSAYVSKMKEDLDTEIPRLQYHMDSWDKEVTRAGYQTRLAGVFARLYPSGEVYDREAYTTVEHYVRSAEVTKAQRDAIAAEQQEAVAGLEMAKGQLLVCVACPPSHNPKPLALNPPLAAAAAEARDVAPQAGRGAGAAAGDEGADAEGGGLLQGAVPFIHHALEMRPLWS